MFIWLLLGYLGSDTSTWAAYDATFIIKTGSGQPQSINRFDDILIDVGTADGFYTAGQLLPEVLYIIIYKVLYAFTYYI